MGARSSVICVEENGAAASAKLSARVMRSDTIAGLWHLQMLIGAHIVLSLSILQQRCGFTSPCVRLLRPSVVRLNARHAKRALLNTASTGTTAGSALRNAPSFATLHKRMTTRRGGGGGRAISQTMRQPLMAPNFISFADGSIAASYLIADFISFADGSNSMKAFVHFSSLS